MVVTPQQLIDWRKRLGLTAKAAAEQLGLSINGYAAYERGYVGRGSAMKKRIPRPIPKHVELACERLEQLKETGEIDANVSC